MESLNYHHLFYFWTVCHEGGFTKAASKLRLSQSAVSEQVRRLEEVLGQKLIERTTRRFELTETGAMALKYADTIFLTGQELLDVLKHRPNTKRQTLRLGALGSLSRNLQVRFLSPLLDRNDVHFTVSVGDSKRLLRLLRDHALDIVLSTFPAGESESGELYTHLLTQSPLCVVAKRSKAYKDEPIAAILEGQKVFMPSRALESRADFDHFVESTRLKLNVAGEVDDLALLRVLALTGKGVVVVPKVGVINEIESKSLIVLHEFKSITQNFYAITRQKKFPNPIIAELITSLPKVVKGTSKGSPCPS